MTLRGATEEELERAIIFSKNVIDCEKSKKELGIEELIKKYM